VLPYTLQIDARRRKKGSCCVGALPLPIAELNMIIIFA
jgi:hypothetical protein